MHAQVGDEENPAKSLGWETIPAFVVEDDELTNRLQEIDENLRRLDLTVYEQAKHAEERERVLGALGQRAARGGSGSNQHASKPATAAGLQTRDVAKEAGMPERSWQRRAKIGKGLGEQTRAVHKSEGRARCSGKTRPAIRTWRST